MLLEKLPSFELQDVNGNAMSTDDYRGKKTLIFMWASW
ncbi:redoxin domain-containing protein [Filobacillus milosensis]|uniref:Redoxin domain-containing protein n=1 Tax=Filobacillus milosensis TaxID=94137 RepID=A0A4Y8IKY4_9BACI|nr:redoxin domain-containing protein [Filobacillus milosensis]TFB21790.1 redoxin domain-containing protein [Filobacillus milosensis]